MNQDVFGVLKDKLTDLAFGYSLQLGGDDLRRCLTELARFPLEVAIGALDAAPIAFPTAFPSPGELAGLCERIAADGAASSDERPAPLVDCEHKFEFEPEPEGGPYAGFEVCVFCRRAIPRPNSVNFI